VSDREFGTHQAPAPRYHGTTTRSLHVTMRDGVKLAIDLILPADLPKNEKIPALVSQTRYWRAREMRAPFKWFLTPAILDPLREFTPFFTSRGYALLLVDVRGTGASFGKWPHPWPEESIQDQADLADWIVAQPWSNGKVGGYGVSYLGTTAELLAVPNHPAIRATIPKFNHPDSFTDIAFPGGIFHERFISSWSDFDEKLDNNVIPAEFGVLGRLMLQGVKPVDGDQGRELLRQAVLEHADNGHAFRLGHVLDYRDEPTAVEGLAVDEICVHRYNDAIQSSPAVSFGWGSWMDAGTADAVIRRFLTFDNAGRAAIGAWEHGGQFNASPYRSANAPTNPALEEQWSEMIRFFDAHLKDGDPADATGKLLYYYVLGEERWKTTSVWPPEGTMMQRWYLAADNALSSEQPTDESGSDSYTVDFEANTGRWNRWWEMGAVVGKTVTYSDRTRAAERILTYTSPPLVKDTEITGYPIVTLELTSTEEDGAFYVYVEDVDEKGEVTYVTEGQLRAIHRKVSSEPSPYRLQVPYHSFKRENAMPMTPGEVTQIHFGLHPTSVLIRKGHRIRIGIAGHDQGTFVRIPAQGTPVISVARNRVHASFIDLPAVGRS
jgi:putative CocE/NonD family hydrolase